MQEGGWQGNVLRFFIISAFTSVNCKCELFTQKYVSSNSLGMRRKVVQRFDKISFEYNVFPLSIHMDYLFRGQRTIASKVQ